MSDDTTTSKPATTTTPKATAPVDDGWVTVSEEQEPEFKLEFNNHGDQFIGKFIGTRNIPGATKTYTQFRFLGDNGDTYFAAGASLENGMKKVRVGSLVRITYVDDQDTGRDSLMKIFRVDVKR